MFISKYHLGISNSNYKAFRTLAKRKERKIVNFFKTYSCPKLHKVGTGKSIYFTLQ